MSETENDKDELYEEKSDYEQRAEWLKLEQLKWMDSVWNADN